MKSEKSAMLELNNDFIQTVKTRLGKLAVHSGTAPKKAAVALIIVDAANGPDLPGFAQSKVNSLEPALILTRRAAKLRSHSGQWALPGGRLDGNETTLEAAIRETREEIGLELTAGDSLGYLDDYETRSGYNMTPLVFNAGVVKTFHTNPDEVASIHRIPVSELLREDAPMLDYDELTDNEGNRSEHPVLRMPIGDDWIAAPTAAVLYQFREVALLTKQTRVAHFDQPRFTWQ